MKRILLALSVGVLGLVPGLGAQQPGPPARPGEHMQQMQQMQMMHQQMEQMMARIHATNQWLQQERSRDQFREMGKQLEEAGDRLQLMLRQMDQLHKDPNITRDQTRAQDRDHLQDRLRDMQRDMDQAHDALCRLAGRTGCGAP